MKTGKTEKRQPMAIFTNENRVFQSERALIINYYEAIKTNKNQYKWSKQGQNKKCKAINSWWTSHPGVTTDSRKKKKNKKTIGE